MTATRVVFSKAWPLHSVSATRQLEAELAAKLPAQTLMQRAGLSTAQLALALAPHAPCFHVICGPGNNGGDGLEAALNLHRWGKRVEVTLLGDPEHAPPDATAAYARALAAGLQPQPTLSSLAEDDCVIDALLGIGSKRPMHGVLASAVDAINRHPGCVLAIDVPSGLDAQTGATQRVSVQAKHTLSLLTLKPGLYTAAGRDASGQVWFDQLTSAEDYAQPPVDETLTLLGQPQPLTRIHQSHKGSFGDVVALGGERGMLGASILAATAALHHGAGRVYVAALDSDAQQVAARWPELMFRAPSTMRWADATVVAGCGGGESIASHLPRVLSQAPRLVLDADGLNAVARDSNLRSLLPTRAARGYETVLTPHPLEAARLLRCDTPHIQSDRLEAARTLAEELQACVVLKGSGTIVASPGKRLAINPTGNGRLATGGTGDVLAGMIGAHMAQGRCAHEAACAAVWLHGHAADRWPVDQPLTATRLAERA